MHFKERKDIVGEDWIDVIKDSTSASTPVKVFWLGYRVKQRSQVLHVGGGLGTSTHSQGAPKVRRGPCLGATMQWCQEIVPSNGSVGKTKKMPTVTITSFFLE